MFQKLTILIYILEQAANEKKLFDNQAIWEAGEFLKTSLASSNNEQPIDINSQINAIKKIGGNHLIKFKLCLYKLYKIIG